MMTIKKVNMVTKLLMLLLINQAVFANVKPVDDVQTKTAKANDTIHYNFQFKNNFKTKEVYQLSIDKPREIVCDNLLKDTQITLAPNEIYKGVLSVVMNDRVPEGGQESSFVKIFDHQGNELQKLEFISVRVLPHPFLLVTNSIFIEAQEKIKQHGWAKNNLAKMLKELDEFEFPEHKIVTKPRPVKVWSSLAYNTSDGEKAFKMGLAWKLTGETKYRDKVVDFIKKVTNKENGYLSIGAATTGVQVHEGNFFLFLAAACDIFYNESSFTKKDHENIKASFQYYLKQNKEHMSSLGIMNHQASANAGAIVVAMFLQDMVELEFLIEADGGMADQIGKGVMADGWWFEGTANYCYLVTQRYSLIAQTFENYGLDLYHRRFPVKYKSIDFEKIKEGFTGMKFDNWGPSGKNTRGLEDMVTPYIPMMDENAYVISTNDSNLKEPNEFYEFAYRAYKKPELAWVINKTKRESWVSLMYGESVLPKVKDPRRKSNFLPNVGLVALRSQPKKKNSNNQIQAFLKYGTHGGWHGHFDRASLIALNRNGHHYFGTEMVWYGYGQPGYKECVQTSASHNMVIVDELQQEAVPSKQLLFYKGELMQASVVETEARWRQIPKWNSEKFPPWEDTDYEEDFEPITQRRLSIVTDDYVVISDYLKSNKKHNYDWLIHPVGLKSIDGVTVKGKKLNQLSTDKDSPYKYFKNAQWYKRNGRVKATFNENGNKLDIHTLWPKKTSVVLSDYPNGGKQRDVRNNPDRKTFGVRVNEKEVVFLNVLEPYNGKSRIDKIESKNINELIVHLIDGRIQRIKISNFKTDNISILLEEKIDGEFKKIEKTRK